MPKNLLNKFEGHACVTKKTEQLLLAVRLSVEKPVSSQWENFDMYGRLKTQLIRSQNLKVVKNIQNVENKNL